jgi:hypothetical protein
MILNQEGKATRPLIRVAVSVPAQDTVAAGFAYDLARMMSATAARRPDIELRLHFLRGTLLPQSRHELVLMALDQDCTHILFLDSDMAFPKDTLVRLLSHREPLVAANYAKRRQPIEPVAMTLAGDPLYVEPGVDGLVEAGAVGMGVMLVDLDVFKRIPAPWFQLGFHAKGGFYVGEDVYFCSLVREHGVPALIDNALSREVSHLGEMEYRSEHALQLRELVRPPEASVIGPQ